MDVTDLSVRWDDDDLWTTSDYGGKHPADDESEHDHKLHFCFYISSASDMIVG